MIFVMPSNLTSITTAIRDARRSAPDAYTVVVGPATDEKTILRVLDEGADEYLDSEILDSEIPAMCVRFKAQAEPEDVAATAGWVIAVLSPSGGSGSSLVAANISVALAMEHGKCGLIDMRFANGDLSSMLNLRPTHSIADVCDQINRIDRGVLEQYFIRHDCGVSLLAPPGQYDDIVRISAHGVRQIFVMARMRFPYVIADLDNAFDPIQIEALWQADMILLMLRMDYTSVRNTRRVIDKLKTLGIKLTRVRLVANCCGERKQLSQTQAEEALGMKISHSIPSDPAVILPSINDGSPAVLSQPSAKVTRNLRQLAHSCNGHYKGPKLAK